MIKLRPLSNRVVVEPESPEKITRGGIHVPDTAKHIPQIGTVLVCGPGFVPPVPGNDRGEVVFARMKMAVVPGDRVFFAKNAGTVITIERDTFIILREVDILAVMEEKEDDKPGG